MGIHAYPPGPKGHWLWGNLQLLRSDVLGFLERIPAEFGDVASLRFAVYRALLLSSPDGAEQVLVTDAKKFQKPPRFRRIVRSAFGQGLFGNEGSDWLTQRRRIQAALDRLPLDSYCSHVADTIQRSLTDWTDDAGGNLSDRMVELALAVRTKTTLGLEQTDEFATIHEAVCCFMDYFATSIQHPLAWPLFVPTAANRRTRATLKRWWEVMEDAIRRATTAGNEHEHLLAALIAQVDASAEMAMSRGQLRDEIATWLLTGTETMANTLTWACYLLAQHSDAQQRVLEESGSLPAEPTCVDATSPATLPYTQQVLWEAMRLYPQAYIIGRKATQPFQLGEYDFPRGTTVVVNQWSIGRNPRWFDDPLSFRPERWADADEQLPKFAFFPFGGGPRICAGRSLAMMELPLAVALLIRQFRFALASPYEARPRPSLTLRPDPNIPFVVQRRV